MQRVLVLGCCALLWGCADEGPSAYADFNLVPNAECIYDPEGDVVFYGEGYYDIAVAGAPEAAEERGCAHSYVLNLRVNSGLRSNVDEDLGRAEPNVLQVTEVEVHLYNLQRERLDFGEGLPNPFRVVATISLEPAASTGEPARGVAKVEVIPTSYGEALTGFVGSQILVEARLYGRTLGDVEVAFKPYIYPVRICMGCFSLCLNRDILDNGMTAEDVLESDVCQDGAGADGRICIDPNC